MRRCRQRRYHSICTRWRFLVQLTFLYILLILLTNALSAGSPTYSRPATTKLAKLTRGRVISVAYSLAPQRPFPAALQDLLLVWLNLLYPADGARHKAVSPDKVVFAGDSAGGNLVLAMVQTMLRIRALKDYKGIIFNNKTVEVSLTLQPQPFPPNN